MNCPFCRRTIVENSECCPYCGNKLKNSIEINQMNVENNSVSYNQNDEKKKPNCKILIIVVLMIIAIMIGVYYMVCQKDKNQKNPTTGTLNNNVNTTYDETGAFLMAIEDVFEITGKGVAVTGKIEKGTIHLGDEVSIIGLNKEIKLAKVISIEKFRETLDTAKIGDSVGITLENISREDIERGQVLALPNSITAITKFEADIHVLSKEEGGRHTPFFNNYRPAFYFRTIDVAGVLTLPESTETVNPGESVKKATVELEMSVALEVGMEFNIREGGRVVGKGIITKVIK